MLSSGVAPTTDEEQTSNDYELKKQKIDYVQEKNLLKQMEKFEQKQP